MTPDRFCFWLKGFLADRGTLLENQVKEVMKALDTVIEELNKPAVTIPAPSWPFGPTYYQPTQQLISPFGPVQGTETGPLAPAPSPSGVDVSCVEDGNSKAAENLFEPHDPTGQCGHSSLSTLLDPSILYKK